jgi:hypothetical protein
MTTNSERPKGMTAEEWGPLKDMSPDLRRAFISMWETMKATPPHETIPVRPPSHPRQLPLWPDAVRGAPNSFLRSAIFAAIQGKTRKYLDEALLGSQGNYAVKFTGAQLDQADLDTWEQVAHLARLHPLGNICMFRGNAFLTSIGRSNGKQNYRWLHKSLTRLVACAVEIRHDKKVFTGSLVSSFIRDEETGLYKITLDPDTLKLFGASDWSSIEWDERKRLKSKPLALWLHGYISSHADPIPIKVETLMKLSGSNTHEKRRFKSALKSAAADLEKVTGIRMVFDGGLVLMMKEPTAAQTRHLIRKKAS